MAQENPMEQGGKIYEFLSEQVFDDDKLYDFDQLSDDEKWDWWLKNKKFYFKEPGFSEVGLVERSKDWKAELAKYPTYMLEDDVLQEIAQNNDLDFETLKQYREENQKEIERQLGRKRREKEIKEAGLLSPWTLASEYSKQRYIDDPDASIFGKEGNYLSFSPTKISPSKFITEQSPIEAIKDAFEGGVLTSEGQEELRDVILGGTAAVGDLIPGYGSLLGTGVRAGRDVYKKASDSPYQKDWSDIVSDASIDAFLNLGTEFLPTAIVNRTGKMAKNSKYALGKNFAEGVQNIQDFSKMQEELANIRAGLKKFEGLNIPSQRETTLKKMQKGIDLMQEQQYIERSARNAAAGLDENENKAWLKQFMINNKTEPQVAEVFSENLAQLGYTIDDLNKIAQSTNGNVGDAILTAMQLNVDRSGREPKTYQQALEYASEDLFPGVTEAIKKELSSQKSARNWVKNLPESPFKNDMASFVNEANWDKKAMSQRIMDWKRALGSDFPVYANTYTSRVARDLPKPVFDFTLRKADTPKLGPWEKAGYAISKAYPTVGSSLVKELETATGRKATKPEETESAKLQRWSKGFATPDEMKTKEYEDFKLEQLNMKELGF